MQLRLTRTPNLETRSSSSSICPRQRAIACRRADAFAMCVRAAGAEERVTRLYAERVTVRAERMRRNREGNVLAFREIGRGGLRCESGGPSKLRVHKTGALHMCMKTGVI